MRRSKPETKSHLSDEECDENLALAARAGSLDAFSKLVRRHQGRLFLFLLQKTGNRQDAEDLAQTTFLKAYRNLSSYRSRDRFAAWLFTIAHRQAISHFRGAFRRQRLYDEIENTDSRHPPDPACVAESRDESRSLWSVARALLNESQQTALWLFYAEGMSMAEIGSVLGKSPGSVKVMLHRARNTLAAELGGKGESRTIPSAYPTEAAAQRQKPGGASKFPGGHPFQPEISL